MSSTLIILSSYKSLEEVYQRVYSSTPEGVSDHPRPVGPLKVPTSPEVTLTR